MIRFIKNILDIKNLLGIIRPAIYLHTYGNNVRLHLSCTGLIKISYIESGVTHTDYYADLSNELVIFTTDANTSVIIIGNVTSLSIPDPNYIDGIDTTKCVCLERIYLDDTQITEIDISHNKQLKNAYIYNNQNLASIIIGELPNLQDVLLGNQPLLSDIDIRGCKSLKQFGAGLTAISELDLTNNPLLFIATFANNPNLAIVRCLAIDSNCANTIALSIQGNSGNAGTVYCNPADPYYSTIATAATNYGWTILPL